jgi:hypothetical protein
MDKNLRIFHSAFYIEGNAIHGKKLLTAYYGNCTFFCRRNNSEELHVAVAFCHHNDTFKKKEGIRVALQHLESGEYITIPVNRGVSGQDLNDVVRSFLNRDTQADYRALCFGTTPNLPIRDWNFVEFTRRQLF